MLLSCPLEAITIVLIWNHSCPFHPNLLQHCRQPHRHRDAYLNPAKFTKVLYVAFIRVHQERISLYQCFLACADKLVALHSLVTVENP